VFTTNDTFISLSLLITRPISSFVLSTKIWWKTSFLFLVNSTYNSIFERNSFYIAKQWLFINQIGSINEI